MGALLQIYRPALMPDDAPSDGSPSDRADHLVVVNLRGPAQPGPGLPAYKLVTHERYPRRPMLVPVGTDGEAVMCGPSGNFAGSGITPGWCDAVEKIAGGTANLVALYDDGFDGGARG